MPLIILPSVRLEFAGGLTVMQSALPDLATRDWIVEFPPESIRAIGK